MSSDKHRAFLRKCRRGNWLFAAFLGLSAVTVSFFISSNISTPARIIENQRIAVVNSKELRFSADVRMLKQCDAMISWWVLDKEENAVIASDTQPGRPSRVGPHEIRNATRRLPHPLDHGEYIYKSVVFDFCTNGKTYTSGSRVPFKIK